jgi:putative Holliday junction resolvase
LGMRTAGIDPGSVRTGIATADDEVPVATPLCTIEHHGLEDAAARVAELLAREQIGLAVVGLPLRLNGQEGEAARKARLFADRLRALSHIVVVLWDERLSSAAATRALAEPRYNPARPRARRRGGRPGDRGRVDRTAATLILQSYLDSQRERTWQDSTNDPEGDSG